MITKKIILFFIGIAFIAIFSFLGMRKVNPVIEETNQQKIEINKNIISYEESNLDNIDKELCIIERLVSWGYKASLQNRLIDTIIIHSSYDALGDDPYSVDGVIQEYKIYGVSPHYLIDRKGDVFQLVGEKNIAYHAGSGEMPDGRNNINNFSIGIEIINTKDVGPNELQYSSLIELIELIKSRYKIGYILGHNEIAPGRKTNPWKFDWGIISNLIPEI